RQFSAGRRLGAIDETDNFENEPADPEPIHFVIPVRMKRRGNEAKFVVEGGAPPSAQSKRSRETATPRNSPEENSSPGNSGEPPEIVSPKSHCYSPRTSLGNVTLRLVGGPQNYIT
ncbi:MAG: hypothetical protein ACLPN5_19980, partial [Roseiarcus sp.]